MPPFCRGRFAALLAIVLVWPVHEGRAGDWPMWRCDAARSNASSDALPAQLHLRWVRQLPSPRPAWPASQTKLQFDAAYHPIITGRLMVLGSTVNDSVTAYDMDTGEEVWRFYTDGPVRFAPVAQGGRVYAASDDGWLYCLDAGSGRLIWKVEGGAGDRRVIGNGRLVSSWPIRGGPVLADGTIYFAAGIWPFMGIFIRAVEAESGRPVWTNSQTGSLWVTHPHKAPAFGSIVPHGYLAVAGDDLIVPGGRSLPAVLDRRTGQLRHFQFGGKGAGGWAVAAHQKFYVVGGAVLSLESGLPLGLRSADVLTSDLLISSMTAYRLSDPLRELRVRDRRGRNVRTLQLAAQASWPIGPGRFRVFAVGGDRAYAASDGQVAAFRIEGAAGPAKKVPEPEWSVTIDGPVVEMLAGDSKLLVVTEEARIYCFGRRAGHVKRFAPNAVPLEKQNDRWSALAEAIVRHSAARDGYALALGIGSGRLIEEIVGRTQLHVITVDPDGDRVDRFRRRMDAAGIYGLRVVAHAGDPATLDLPPYFASLIFSEDLPAAGLGSFDRFIPHLFQPLRPYGGLACFALSPDRHRALARAVEKAGLRKAEVARAEPLSMLRRVGSLPGAGSWTHQYADAANSVVSQDQLVKAPLGVLWFGGPSNRKILPRHGHGPSPQVAGGRLVIEGPHLLRCIDVYTGRVLWEKRLPNVGKYYNRTEHFPGAGEIGSNYVTLPDAVYVVYGDTILQLDAATGRTNRQFKSRLHEENALAHWGFLAVEGDLMIAASDPVTVGPSGLTAARYGSASRRIVAFHRRTGRLLWSRTARLSFRHNNIVLGGGKVYCIDGMSAAKLQSLRRRGIKPGALPRLLALDGYTGKEIWSTDRNVFGTFLNYSVRYDILLQAGSQYRDRARDEVGQGMIAYRGRDGKVIWKDLSRRYNGPCLLWRDKIITNGSGGYQLDLRTGRPTGWHYTRMYGCNTVVGSQHLLTFRSGAAGFCDLASDSGTGNLGGFRSSCTANLIAADGVLSAPDYTRTCLCAYQNQCSLALIHMPEAEMWTFSNRKSAPDRFALNLGAPGDRRGPDGTMWYDLPSVGGNSPELPITLRGSRLRTVRHHSSRIAGGTPGSLAWVAASCVVGLERIEQKLSGHGSAANRRRTVRLHFAELEGLQPGQRVFDVYVGGQRVLESFDIARAAGGPFRPVVKPCPVVAAGATITVRFVPIQGEPCVSGMEVVAEQPR